MSLVRSHPVSLFTAKKAPPAPVVLLLSQTTLHMPTFPGRLIHEDLKTLIKKLKKVVFAAAPHTYPPPSIVPNLIPTPQHLSTKTVENHKGWKIAPTETELIKALEMHPVLHEFENEWATCCIIMAHLKARAAAAKPTSFALVRHSILIPYSIPCLQTFDDDGGRPRPASNAAKVRLIGGPQSKEPDSAREDKAYHRDQAALARQRTRTLNLELQNAQKLQAEQTAHINTLNEELARRSETLIALQQHEMQLEAQFVQDQAKFQQYEVLAGQYHAMIPQMLEAQKLLMQRNQDVERLNQLVAQKQNEANTDIAHLNRLLAEKQDETIQLRALNHLRGRKAQNKPAPDATRTIQIPLDPIPIPEAPSGEPNPQPKANLDLGATPELADLLHTDVPTLDDLIGQLKQLLINSGATVDIEKTTPKKGTRSKSKKTADKKLPKDLKNYIHAILRKTTYIKFGMRQAADFILYNPADGTRVAACETELIDPPCALYQWDFSTGYLDSRWNQKMIEKIVDAVLKDEGEDGDIPRAGVGRAYLEELMQQKLARYQGAWKGFQPRFDADLGRIETNQEANARGARAFEQHQLATRSNFSKHRKYTDRIQTIIAAIEIKKVEGVAADIATWERLLRMVELLGEQGMSSEEEDELEADDAKVLVFKVKICIWREPRVVEYLRFVDAQTALFKKHQVGPIPAPRIRTRAVGNSKVPRGLPKSLYNSKWLKNATPAYLNELKVSKEVFELFVAAMNRMAI
ncbi:hypothetical protein B0H16DRAFT_1720176 [Mycena metata]|uniref:Uncharacterized protein n=1 Tax=Mycena metata TaxID=1033252 RepID=A0AAD7NH05_9AGAR|nr:hypothetical protein B0H16DRAFT_1720176 [Mycena metata]